MPSKILVIEDNNEINGLLCDMLSKNGYLTQPAYSGTEGMLYLSMTDYAVILLDLMLPGKSGEEILQEIRKQSSVPVIIISAKSGMEEKVDLLENGADDYITKPFDVREVMARIKLQMKKDNHQLLKHLKYEELEIEPESWSVKIAGNELSLTKQEYNIIYLLVSNPNKVFTKQELFEEAWEEYYIGADKTINVHISNIRNKIRQFTEKNYIETVWGIGFRMEKY